jgi:hypothetical protein
MNWRAMSCVIGLALAAPGVTAGGDFASTSIDFLGRGRACGLVASPGRPDDLFWNASGMAWRGSSSGSAFAGWLGYLAGLRGGVAGYVGGARAGRCYGGYVAYLSSGSQALTTWDDPTGGLGETFSWNEVVGGLAGGGRFVSRVSVGGGVKVVRQTLADQAATGLLADLSGTATLYETGEQSTRAFGCIAARNLVLGTWGTASDPGSGCLEIGTAVDFAGGRHAVGCSVLFGRGGRREACVGLSALLSDEFEARLGYRRRTGLNSDASHGFGWQRGLAAGFSVGFGKFWIDYTYEDASPLDGVHRLAVRAGAADWN